MLTLLVRKIIVLLFFLIPLIGFAQKNVQNKHADLRRFNLGFYMGLNYSQVKLKYAELENNPRKPGLKDIIVRGNPGINLGMISNLKIIDNLDFRFTPSVSLTQRNFKYVFGKDSVEKRRLEASYLDFPFAIKYKSEFWANHRVAVSTGIKYSINLASDKKVRDDPNLIKIEKTDICWITSFSIDLYGEKLKLSPEITYSLGLKNIYVPENTSYGNNIKSIRSQCILIGLNFE